MGTFPKIYPYEIIRDILRVYLVLHRFSNNMIILLRKPQQYFDANGINYSIKNYDDANNSNNNNTNNNDVLDDDYIDEDDGDDDTTIIIIFMIVQLIVILKIIKQIVRIIVKTSYEGTNMSETGNMQQSTSGSDK